MPIVITRERTYGLYLPKERSDYLPLTSDSQKVELVKLKNIYR